MSGFGDGQRDWHHFPGPAKGFVLVRQRVPCTAGGIACLLSGATTHALLSFRRRHLFKESRKHPLPWGGETPLPRSKHQAGREGVRRCPGPEQHAPAGILPDVGA
ncbi:unnamed protein product [Symbiodinium necroappetens]|uniref:Uncharacterized protein n=1 Tax=Symbiodinium necroappetens TaxID=1628268 RepID=A0A813BNU7_9DINO|nr:unnamed protein product [Symbiodinium necroappetens]